MDWPIILLGIIIGLMAVTSKSLKPEHRQAAPATVEHGGAEVPVAPVYPELPSSRLDGNDRGQALPEHYLQRSIPRQMSPSPNIANERVSSKDMLETWRKSIVGLVKLAQRNLTYARQHLESGDYTTAVEAAVTSVENISRALMHCYGEKPELNSGQEEALRLLSLRLKGNEKIEFEKAIEEVTRLYHNKIVQRYLSTRNIGFSFLHTKARTALLLNTASRIFTLFAQIIDKHFATEIPELREACPKCHAIDISVWCFNEGTVNYTCNLCKHRWIQPRTF